MRHFTCQNLSGSQLDLRTGAPPHHLLRSGVEFERNAPQELKAEASPLCVHVKLGALGLLGAPHFQRPPYG